MVNYLFDGGYLHLSELTVDVISEMMELLRVSLHRLGWNYGIIKSSTSQMVFHSRKEQS